jgi:hypothetical protein
MKIEDACKAIMDDRDIKASTGKGICGNLKMFAKDLKEIKKIDYMGNIKAMLNNYTDVGEYIENKKGRKGESLAINSKKTYYTACKSASVVLKCDAQAIKYYDIHMTDNAKESDEQRDKSEVPEKFTDGRLPPWTDVKDLPSKFEGRQKYSIQHLIVSLYVMQPPRRLEYRLLYLLDKKPNGELKIKPRFDDGAVDDKGIPYNFIYPNGDTYDVVLRDYKTIRKKGFGVFKTTFSKTLADVIKGYIVKEKTKVGTPLFPTKTGKNQGQAMLQPNFDKKFKEAFAVHYNKVSLTEQNIRDMYVDSEVKQKSLPVGEEKRIAYLMGHTFKTQQESYGKNQPSSGTKSTSSTSSGESEQDSIRTERIEPEPMEGVDEQQAESEPLPQPSVEILEEVEKLDTTTKEDVLRSIKRYYDAKYELVKRQLEMLDKTL